MHNRSEIRDPTKQQSAHWRFLWFGGVVAALLFGCGAEKSPETPSSESSEKVTVLVAASTTNVIQDIVKDFQDQNPKIQIEVSPGPSNGLAQQILAGAPADIFLSTNQEWADAVKDEDLADEIVKLVTNRIVLIVPKGNPARIENVDDLNSPKVARVAIAGENVPAGMYAEQALRKLDLLEPLMNASKLARGSDVRITLTYVERQEAEAGIVYATDAKLSSEVEVLSEFDPKTYDPVTYPAVLLKSAKDKEAARSFFEFLKSSEAQARFREHGFTPLESQE